MEKFYFLDVSKLMETIEQLRDKISTEFPGSGLSKLSRHLWQAGHETSRRVIWISRPFWPLRLLTWSIALLIPAGMIFALYSYGKSCQTLDFVSLMSVMENGTNQTFLVTAFVIFLITLEKRVKRDRALRSLHELRSIAHIIDMHQLTKDPEGVLSEDTPDEYAGDTKLTQRSLRRYLDLCTDMLSLTAKIAAIYLNRINDATVVSAVNEIEQLTTGLSRKIWQKILTSQQWSGNGTAKD